MILFLALLLIVLYGVESQTVSLERGTRGIVPCPLITSKQNTLESVDDMYWYFKGSTSDFFIISHYQGNIASKPGIPADLYDIDSNYSLVIKNVCDRNEGKYVYKLKPKSRMVRVGNVPVTVHVSPENPVPEVTVRDVPEVFGCDVLDSSPTDATCEIDVSPDTPTYNLTCTVRNAKPAVTLVFVRVLSDGQTSPINTTNTIVKENILPENTTNPGRFNTFTTSASIQISLISEDVRYRCQAFGAALGERNGSQVTVNLSARLPSVTDPNTLTDVSSGVSANMGDDSSMTTSSDDLVKPWMIAAGVAVAVCILIVVCIIKRRRKGLGEANKCFCALT